MSRLYVSQAALFGGRIIRRGYHESESLEDAAAYLVTHGYAVVVPDEPEPVADEQADESAEQEADTKPTPPKPTRRTKRG